MDRDTGRPLRPFTEHSNAIIAFVDESGIIRGLYATRNFAGSYSGVRPGMTGDEVFCLHPEWSYREWNASIADPNAPGFYVKHQEDDLDPSDVGEEAFDFLGIFDPDGPYFT